MDIYFYRATVDRVVDGDTCDAIVDLGFKVFLEIRIRLYGIDAYESRTVNKTEKQKGLEAKERHRELIEGKVIKLQSNAWDKYGRCVATIWLEDSEDSINNILVKEGHAVYKEY